MQKLNLYNNSQTYRLLIAGLTSVGLLIFVPPAFAHHAFGGTTPSNFLQGFLSGLAHPVIGIDHLSFVIAAGLLSALKKRGFLIPLAFVLAALAGTLLHLMSLDLPVPEIIISASVLIFGIMLAMQQSPNSIAIMLLATLAGIFHGYAYGEAIIGARMTPLVAYLTGFTLIQTIVALVSFKVSSLTLKQLSDRASLNLRFAGFTICGIGTAFLASAIVG